MVQTKFKEVNKMTNNLTSIDLFAGCGGLSLGLEQAGFETIFVNELNPDAMDSFLINRQDNPYLKDPANRLYDLVELTQDPEALQRLRTLFWDPPIGYTRWRV